MKSGDRMDNIIRIKQMNYNPRPEEKASRAKVIVLWMVFCLAGNLSQVYHISSLYFQYGINTNVQLVVRDNMEIPATTLCFDLTQVLKWTKLTPEERYQIFVVEFKVNSEVVRQNILKDYDALNETNESLDNLPKILKEFTDIGEKMFLSGKIQTMNLSRLFDLSYKDKEVVDSIVHYVKFYELTIPDLSNPGKSIPIIKTVNGYFSFFPGHKDFNEVFSVTTFFKDAWKCYTFELKEEYKNIQYYDVRRQTLFPGLLSMIHLKTSGTKDAGLINYVVTPNGKKLASGFFSFLPIAVEDNHSYSVTYETYEASLLQKPFESGCMDYGIMGSRGDCYESCVKDNGLSLTGRIFPGINIYPEDYDKTVITNMDILSNQSFAGLKTGLWMNKLHDMCESKCHAGDCFSITMIPKPLVSHKVKKGTRIVIMVPTTPRIVASSQPRLTLVQYLIDLFSTFGFWLGVSAFEVFNFFRRSKKALQQAYHVNEIQDVTIHPIDVKQGVMQDINN